MSRAATFHSRSFEERIAALSAAKVVEAELLPHGPARDALLFEARHLKTASDMHRWLSPAKVRSPA